MRTPDQQVLDREDCWKDVQAFGFSESKGPGEDTFAQRPQAAAGLQSCRGSVASARRTGSSTWSVGGQGAGVQHVDLPGHHLVKQGCASTRTAQSRRMC